MVFVDDLIESLERCIKVCHCGNHQSMRRLGASSVYGHFLRTGRGDAFSVDQPELLPLMRFIVEEKMVSDKRITPELQYASRFAGDVQHVFHDLHINFPPLIRPMDCRKNEHLRRGPQGYLYLSSKAKKLLPEGLGFTRISPRRIRINSIYLAIAVYKLYPYWIKYPHRKSRYRAEEDRVRYKLAQMSIA